MAKIEKSVDVDVPVSVAYNQWTQFEEFPQFMEGVDEVSQLDDTRLHWKATIAGKTKEWYSKITEQIPDQRIAWTSEGGTFTAGVVTFHRIDENETRVMLQMEYDPEGILDSLCSAMSTIASNTAVLSGHCAVALGLEHARTIAKHGWTRNDIKSYLCLNSGNRFAALSRGDRYGKVYNRNLPKWYKREPDSRIPIVESPDRIHLFVVGGHAGRFAAFIPGWGHMSTPVLRPITGTETMSDDPCADGMCKL